MDTDLDFLADLPDLNDLQNDELKNEQAKSYKSMTDKIAEFEVIEEISKLKKQNKRQKLILEAIWSILKSQGSTDEQLIEALAEVDISEVERAQRQREKKIEPCPNCQVTMMRTEGIVSRCIYCGHESIGNPFDF
ncbi:MAG TPA: hypothetical protein GXZ67_05905 [Clostridiaceae bacterium]|nr:hypothetical protein [Clostridiaceae bacterium]